MPRLQILDTFPAFEKYWRGVRSESVEMQIDRWEHDYMAPWPELLEKQKKNYSEIGVDWKRTARTRIFPRLRERLPLMRRIHRNLLRTLPDAWSRTTQALDLEFQVRFVIYAGIGVGAGWATRFGGQPACLFGLENAAEIASGKQKLGTAGTISHEIAHLAHDEWRRRAGLGGNAGFKGPFLQLYEEGFATECERRIGNAKSFRLRRGEEDWIPWCTAHRAWLSPKFLRDVHARRSVRPFFGSWYNIRGHIECGYYLGQEMVRDWAEATSLQEVAVLPEVGVRRKARASLSRVAERGARP
ncbi:MAG: hypothetical protein L3K02_04570 [Thermoplasmata archaeon]|nr:hypothetical protein [Thermoplasmata archaeon]